MQRGKIIGAVVLVAAVGLVLAQQFGLFGTTGSDTGSAGAPATAGTAVMPAAGAPAPAPADAVPGRIFTVDAAQSEVYWRIYKAGAMARLGHNHVISIGELSGEVVLGADPASSAWDLSFPVAGLSVDDPAIRARHGEDFESVPSEDDKAGTKSNMLTEAVLNGEQFPEIRLSGQGFSGTFDAAELPVTIELLGRRIERRFPAMVRIDGDALIVTGEYRLTHDDFGMTPFSLLGGIISVGNEIDFSYRIHAVAGGR